jgi:hypothetical protein
MTWSFCRDLDNASAFIIRLSRFGANEALFNYVAPSSWVSASLESRELLALCLKKLSLNRTRIIDASFIWTEPHSRRVRVKLVVQAAVAEDKVMQQALEVTYGELLLVLAEASQAKPLS